MLFTTLSQEEVIFRPQSVILSFPHEETASIVQAFRLYRRLN